MCQEKAATMSKNYWWAYWITTSANGTKMLKGIKGHAPTEAELVTMMSSLGKSRNDYETVCLPYYSEHNAKLCINDLIGQKVKNIDTALQARYRTLK